MNSSSIESPLVSLICPCYRAGKVLGRLLDSLLGQTYTRYEVIVVDGGSTDAETMHILQKYEARVRLISEPDKGIYDAMNKGVEAARGNWLYFIGADDSLYDANVLNDIFSHPIPSDCDMIIGRAYFGERLTAYRLTNKIYWENCLLHQAVFYSRRVFTDFRYNSAFRVSSDYDLNFYCYRQGFRPHYTSTIICRFSLKGVSSSVNFQSYREEMSVRAKYVTAPLRPLLSIYSYARFAARKILNMCR